MLRAITVLVSLCLLTACVTNDPRLAGKSGKLRNAQAAATPVMLGTAY
jgi:hypothetical protein